MGDGNRALLDTLVTAWPIVGRERVVERALERLDRRTGGVVLTGPAGVGKSRIGRLVVAAASRRGFATEWIQATDATREISLGAFAPLLPKDAADVGSQVQLLRRAMIAILEGARRRPLLLAVDDAHLLDPASATLVQHLASADGATVLVTTRSGEAAPDAIIALWKDGIADRIDVGPLEQVEVATLLRAALGDEVEGATALRLWTATRGNALYLHELVLAGVRSGALHRLETGWRWRGPLTGDGGLREVLQARLAPLSAGERDGLDLLAIGEPLGIDVFERLVGVMVVDHLERQELVSVRRADRREEAYLAHPLYRDLLGDAMSAERTAAIRARLAVAVQQAGGRRRGDLLRVATWQLGAGVGKDPALLLAAADEADARFDSHLAERLARAAADANGGAAAWHGIATALRGQGRNVEADDAWQKALTIETDAASRVMLAQARSANLFFGLGEGARAIDVLDLAIPDATTQELRDALGALSGLFDLYRGRIDAALAASMPILQRSGNRVDARIDAAMTASVALALRGRPDDAIAVVDDHLGFALQHPQVAPIAAGALMMARILAQTLDGRLVEAKLAAEVVYDLAVDRGASDGVAAVAYLLGQLHGTLGDVHTARRLLAEASVLLREHDRNGYLPWALAELAYVEILVGDLDRARQALVESDRVTRAELRLFRPRAEIARHVLRAVEGDVPAAVEGLVAAADAAVKEGHLVLGASTLYEAVRFGQSAPVVDLLGRLAFTTESALVRLYADHARAAADDDGMRLSDVADRFEEIGALVSAADAAAGSAASHGRAGRNAERVAAEQRTQALLDRCPGAAPPWHRPSADIEPLSDREQEVAELAAQGHSSREIAGRLYLSVRTVDNHLYRCYSKLGIASRDELAVVLGVSADQG